MSMSTVTHNVEEDTFFPLPHLPLHNLRRRRLSWPPHMAKKLAHLRLDDMAADLKRRSVLIKQTQLTTKKNGKRHHNFDKEKAPYPLSYDRTSIDLDVIDHVFLTQVRKSVSFVDFEGETPDRCLDLGCGTGTWILDASKEWPDCEFVGFDLVNIQPTVSVLEPTQSKRVKWVHGNFLTTKLPFDDDEFDHIHIRSIARAVPESKWNYLFDEISRVLRPGGTIEMIEDDIRFPTLPTWYSRGLRARDRQGPSIQMPEGSLRMAAPPSPPPSPPPMIEAAHDHALLESLYNYVFETRFINQRPTAILPSYFSTYFRQVRCSPVINFPMPPLPSVPTFNIAASRRYPDPPAPPSSHVPRTRSIRQQQQQQTQRESTSSESSESSTSHFSDVSTDAEEDEDVADQNVIQQRTPPTSDDEAKDSSKENVPSSSSSSGSNCHTAQPTPTLVKPYYTSFGADIAPAERSSLGLLPLAALTETSTAFSLALQLHRSYNFVLACEEAMWEVLNDRIRNREEELRGLGWDDDDGEDFESSAHARQRFDTLLARYKGDMQTRAALWQTLLLAKGTPIWTLPTVPGFLSKAEANDEERLYRTLLDAQSRASEEELREPCRTLRVFVGRNA